MFLEFSIKEKDVTENIFYSLCMQKDNEIKENITRPITKAIKARHNEMLSL